MPTHRHHGKPKSLGAFTLRATEMLAEPSADGSAVEVANGLSGVSVVLHNNAPYLNSFNSRIPSTSTA